jgi:hypothetical protein
MAPPSDSQHRPTYMPVTSMPSARSRKVFCNDTAAKLPYNSSVK